MEKVKTMNKKEAINKLILYKHVLSEIIESVADLEGIQCFNFDTEPFDTAIINIKMNADIKELKIMDKLEIIINNICDNYCKYPYMWDEESEGVSLVESGICDRCPLNELEKIKNDSYQINVKLKHDPVENEE